MSKLPKPLFYGLFLLILGIIIGGLLAGVNALTAPLIAENELEQVRPIIAEKIAPDCDKIEDATLLLGRLPSEIKKVFYAYENDVRTTIIYWTTTIGYNGGEVKTLTAITLADGSILNVAVSTANNQTSGIGDQILTYNFPYSGADASDYASETTDSFKKGDPEIISGATVSSKAVLGGVIIAANHFEGYNW